MGKFSFDKDFAKRVSMHRDPEQHKKRGDNLNARKNRFSTKTKRRKKKQRRQPPKKTKQQQMPRRF